MKIRAIDAEGDWEFGKGLSNYKIDQEAVKENIQTRLLEWQGDCFFAADAGIDWKNRIEKNQQDLLEAEVKSMILKSEAVVSLQSLAVVFLNRTLTVSYAILTLFSESIQRVIIKEDIANG